ncbi:MAG TPA: hypothetical protein VIX18_01300 [Nitrospirota bacterium]
MRTTLILKAVGLFVLAFSAIVVGGGYWIVRTEDACWKHEAVEAFQRYGALKTRSGILRVADAEGDRVANPLEVVEKDPNGCSFGSNGRTIVRFSFDKRNKLTSIQVFRDYVASDYQMELIEERKY